MPENNSSTATRCRQRQAKRARCLVRIDTSTSRDNPQPNRALTQQMTYTSQGCFYSVVNSRSKFWPSDVPVVAAVDWVAPKIKPESTWKPSTRNTMVGLQRYPRFLFQFV